MYILICVLQTYVVKIDILAQCFPVIYLFVLQKDEHYSSKGSARIKFHILINPLKQNWTFLFLSFKTREYLVLGVLVVFFRFQV